ncbi:MAG: ATP-binding protein [Bacteroidetes bacterium]|nr:ATP-binding protein [Bacteroidota bacterium]
MQRDKDKTIRIAITGPESTGKSELAKTLAQHYSTLWVPEYAREYLENIHRPYNEDDILLIAKEQKIREDKTLRMAKRFLFCDTEALVTKIWSIVKYGHCDPWILDQINSNPHDLYLLCNIDLPWEEDPLREHPDKREYLFNLYVNELKVNKLPYGLVSGFGVNRLQNAINIIEQAF